MRLSCGSAELQTRQWHASVGTPMDVPEPSTVSLSSEFCGEEDRTNPSAGLGLVLCGSCCRGLGHFHKGEFQIAEQINNQRVFFGSQISARLFAQSSPSYRSFPGRLRGRGLRG